MMPVLHGGDTSKPAKGPGEAGWRGVTNVVGDIDDLDVRCGQ